MNYFKGKTLLASCAVFALLQGASTLQAENVHMGKEAASTAEIIEMLNPTAGTAKVRGLRFKEEPQTPRSISLEVYFDFDSAVLSSEAAAQLAPVGEALASEALGSFEFGLAGYTDASGDESYNLSLSERRANAVRDFLVEKYGVSGDRLGSEGRGESDLLDPENPNSGVNRRVKITTK